MILLNLGLVLFAQNIKADNDSTDSREGLPTYRRGGGSRGGCLANRGQLVALIPENAVGKTTAALPKLFFYIPQDDLPQAVTLEFVLRDRQDKLVYESFFTTDGKSGIVSVDLPESSKSKELKTNEQYHWYLSMICDPQNRSRDVVVKGWIQRVEIEPAIEQKLARSNPLERASLYQKQDLWYDALSTLAEQKQAVDSQLRVTAKWTELLESVGLGDLAGAQFIEPYRVSGNIRAIFTKSP
ncbi:DUF928 domain-containing protein [Pleurocapsales cyanobacterium LEGE 06147]|nr:DUF928 domain-containing protein [Pleurocapsales cyanobacterium LEGE 06147]